MRTDEHLYAIFRHEPRWLFLLADRPDPGECQFRSEQFKSIQRTCDGLIEPEDPAQPLTIVEFQLASGEDPYVRLVEEMTAAQRLASYRAVEGIIFFGRGVRDPKTPPWTNVVTSYVFEELVRRFAENRPDHPLSHLVYPLAEENNETLEARGAQHYAALRHQRELGKVSTELCDVFVDLFWQRFRHKTKTEIDMVLLKDLPSLDQTVAGQEIMQMGREDAFRKVCLRQAGLKFGELPASTLSQIKSLTYEQLEELLDDILSLDSLASLQEWLDHRVQNSK